MKNSVTLYKKPFIVGTVFLVASLIMFSVGMYIASADNNSDGFALVAFAVLFFITAVSILAVYGGMERKFKKTLAEPLLDFELDPGQYGQGADINASQVKQSNKASLFIMLFFCLVVIVAGFFIEDEGYIFSMIGLGLAVFLTICFLLITAYRVRKIKRGIGRVALSTRGAYVGGEFYCWETPATYRRNVQYIEEPLANGLAGYIEIEFASIALPAPTYSSCVIPIPDKYKDNAQIAVNIINMAQ